VWAAWNDVFYYASHDAASSAYTGVNGMASSYEDINPIWADDPASPGLKKNIGPLINAGLEMCD
jgi:hypothetical protein